MLPGITKTAGNKRRVWWICGFFLLTVVVTISVLRESPFHRHVEIMTTNVLKIVPNFFRAEADVPGWTNVSTQYNYEPVRAMRYKVICMILTRPSNWETRGKAVKNTWAKRCHKAIFFYTRISDCSSEPICKESSAVGLNVPDGRDHLTAKTLGALNYSYVTYGSDADYFLKADDDTYVITENLQRMLSRFRSIPRLYLGRRIDNILPKGYNSGGAGYIISNEAAKLFVQNRTMYPDACRPDGGYEDVEVGKCLAKFGIYPQDDLDSTGRLTFHSDNPFRVLMGEEIAKHYYINIKGAEFGNKQKLTDRGFMLSTWTATMHYVRPAEIYMFEFLLYDVGNRKSANFSSKTNGQSPVTARVNSTVP